MFSWVSQMTKSTASLNIQRKAEKHHIKVKHITYNKEGTAYNETTVITG